MVKHLQEFLMSVAEMMELLPTLTSEERIELMDQLGALEEGVSLDEFRAIRAAIDEALRDPSPSVPVEEVYKDLERLVQDHATSTQVKTPSSI